MIRLDKFLCDTGLGTRTEVKQLIKKGQIQVNNGIVKKAEYKLNEEADSVFFQGRVLSYQKTVYIMLHKPAGVVSATEDSKEKTVIDLCQGISTKDLFPVGRLDKDTEGLLLLTNDGELSHALLSPKRHVVKKYEVHTKYPVSLDDSIALEEGVDIGDEKKTLPAKVTLLGDNKLYLYITEGRFHQIKRMLEAVGNEVVYLKRLQMASLSLDESLEKGAWRYLTDDEIEELKTYYLYKRLPKISGKEAVIFDVDGSLVDSMWMWKKIDRDYLAKFNVPLPSDLQLNIEGMSFYQTACYFKEHFPISHSIEEMMATWNEMALDKYKYEVPLKPGTLQLMQYCKENGIKMGIATSNSRELLEIIAKVHGFYDYISCIKTGSDITNGKPAPDIYLAVAEELQVNPSKCLVFEDIPAGIKAGKAAGMEVCAVKDAYSMDSDREKHHLADYYLDDYRQLNLK